MVTMFSLKVVQDPRLHFRRKKIPKKISASWVFQKNFSKAIFDGFSNSIPYITELRLNTGSMVSQIVQAFRRPHFNSKMTSNFFSYLFFGQKRKKMSKIFFSFVAHFSQTDKRYRIHSLSRKNKHRCRLLFGPTKFPSSSMTLSFCCQKYLNFL